ncbi:MAG: hypothetical protein RL087_534 [Pseudomonadota bacterium]|jgi:undecaprenyl-diphosphatase
MESALQRLRAFDETLFLWIGAGNESSSEWTGWSVGFSSAGVGLLMLCWVSALVIRYHLRGTRYGVARDALVCAVLMWLAQSLAHGLAAELGAPRPFMLGLADNLLGHSQRGGLPSTHAFVMAALVGWGHAVGMPAAWRAIAWAAVGMTALGRVYAGVHFVSDVTVGAALGWCLGALTTRFAIVVHGAWSRRKGTLGPVAVGALPVRRSLK